MPFAFETIFIAFLICLTGVFAAYEMALASISRARLHALAEQQHKGARDAIYMKDNMEASLAVTQLGITLIGALAAAIGGAGVDSKLVPIFEKMGLTSFWAEAIAFVCLIIPLSALTIIFAELTPKMFALRNKEFICLSLSPIMHWIARILTPIIWFFEFTVKKIVHLSSRQLDQSDGIDDEDLSLHELRAATSLARSSRLLGARQEKIVLAAAQLSFRPIKEIIIPVQDICTIPLNVTLMDAFLRAHMDMHTRFPVCEDEKNPQSIVGYVNFKDILVALKINPSMPSIQGIMRPIKSFQSSNTIAHVLEGFIIEKTHIALVKDHQQQILGLITLEDIIEEMTGEIEDEFDKLPAQIYTYGDSWVVGGGMKMDVLAQHLGVQGNYQSIPLSQWCLLQHQTPFKGGEVLTFDNFDILIRKLKRKQIAEALVTKKKVT